MEDGRAEEKKQEEGGAREDSRLSALLLQAAVTEDHGLGSVVVV